MSLVDTAMAKMQTLSPERQQEIIDFIDFLLSREPIKLQPDERLELPSSQEAVSVLEAAGDLIGCVEGPTDDCRTYRRCRSAKSNVSPGE